MEYEKIIELINDFGNSKLNNLKLDFPDGTKIDMSKGDEKVKFVNVEPNIDKEEKIENKVTSCEKNHN